MEEWPTMLDGRARPSLLQQRSQLTTTSRHASPAEAAF